ncbi:MAG: hypothetical protein ACRDRJ_45345 [Streptosporangiaceae bacterium]
MDELKSSGKPFQISKQEVWGAWIKVKGNKGAPGVDGQSVEAFEADLSPWRDTPRSAAACRCCPA